MKSEITLESVASSVAEWRRTKGRLLSKEIWSDVSRLLQEHPVPKVSAALQIPKTSLYRRLRTHKSEFYEVQTPAVLPETKESIVVELTRGDGGHIRMMGLKRSELPNLVASFLQ